MANHDSQPAETTVSLASTTEVSCPEETSATVVAKPFDKCVAIASPAKGTIIGRYVVIGPLGVGGMGVVVKAHDPDLDRTVALKLLRPDSSARREAADRLLREAQALAQLAHPNVVSVFDVGESDGTVFIAMELIEGMTLRKWLRKQTRSSREIIGVFQAAGRGLCAAHAAGLIHRDFKPSNVLVGTDGRVRVLDFGLARVSGQGEGNEDSELNRDSSPTGESLLGTNLTRVGVVVGTPNYMSPEQHTGKPVDARSDQFSFCVTLHRALVGEFPSHSKDKDNGRAVDRSLPNWLQRCLRRGLAGDPAERFSSMDQLLRVLERGQGRRRRAVVALTASMFVGASAALLVVMSGSRSVPDRCTHGAREAAEVWNDSVRGQVEQAFTSSGRPGAVDTWRRVDVTAASYARRWARMRNNACAATHIHGTQSETLLDRRMLCMDRKLAELSAVTQLLRRAQAKEIDSAVELVASLTPVRTCAASEALLRSVALTQDPAQRAVVRTISANADRAKILLRVGRLDDAHTLAKQAVTDATQLGNKALIAEALYRLGDIQVDTDGFEAAGKTTRRAFLAAVAAGHDNIAAWSALRMLYLASYAGMDSESVDNWAGIADAHRDRVAEHSAFGSRLEQYLALLAVSRDNQTQAVTHIERAAAILAKDSDARPIDVSDLLTHAAHLYTRVGQPKLAISRNEKALSMARAFAGPANIIVGRYLINSVAPLTSLGRAVEARKAAHDSLAILEPLLGKSHAFVAQPVLGDARALVSMRRFAAASKQARRAIGIYQNHPGPNQSWLVDAQLVAAQVEAKLGAHERAFAYASRIVAIAEAAPQSARRWANHAVLDAATVAAGTTDQSILRQWLKRLRARNINTAHWRSLRHMAHKTANALRESSQESARRLADLLDAWRN